MIGILMAGGLATRMRTLPITKVLPKCLLPIVGKPIIEHNIETMITMGVDDIVVVSGHLAPILTDYLENGRDWKVPIRYVHDPDMKGVANALLLVEPVLEGEEFVLINADDLTSFFQAANMVDRFRTLNAEVMEAAFLDHDVERLKRSCCMDLDGLGTIKAIEEKPEDPKYFYNGAGVYLFQRSFFEVLRKQPVNSRTGRKELTDAIGRSARKGVAYAYTNVQYSFNINTHADLAAATRRVLGSRDGTKETNK